MNPQLLYVFIYVLALSGCCTEKWLNHLCIFFCMFSVIYPFNYLLKMRLTFKIVKPEIPLSGWRHFLLAPAPALLIKGQPNKTLNLPSAPVLVHRDSTDAHWRERGSWGTSSSGRLQIQHMDNIGETVTSGGESPSLQPSLRHKLYVRYLHTDGKCKHVITVIQLWFLGVLFKLN